MRRHLGFSREEWDGLKWWEQRMYLEGWEMENSDEHRPEPGRQGPAPITPVTTEFSCEPGEFAAFGFREQTLN